MKKYIWIVLLVALPAIAWAAAPENTADILEKTAAFFRKGSGIRAKCRWQMDEKTEEADIRLKGDKFVLQTSEATTWFDGKTQWSYVAANNEVNVSTPTEEELQQINPYAFLNMYKQGYTYKQATTKMFRGRAVWEVTLTATDKRQPLERITLYIAKDTYEPLYFRLRQRGQQAEMEITVTSCLTRQKFADKEFTFDRRQYPTAEIIDLR